MSISNYYTFDEINNIAVYFTGKDIKKANLLELVLNLNKQSYKYSALKMLKDTTKKMFEALHLNIPDKLLNNIENAKVCTYSQDGLRIELRLEKSKIETWVIRIIPL